MSFLSFKTAQRIDLERIWKEQGLTLALEKEINQISRFVHAEIINPPAGANIGEWCKKEKCWDSIREHGYSLSEDLERELVSAGYVSSKTVATSSIDSLTEEENKLIDEAAEVSAEKWFALSRWAKETNNFQPWQRSLLFSVGSLAGRGRKPSIKQARHALKTLEEAEFKGFTMN